MLKVIHVVPHKLKILTRAAEIIENMLKVFV